MDLNVHDLMECYCIKTRLLQPASIFVFTITKLKQGVIVKSNYAAVLVPVHGQRYCCARQALKHLVSLPLPWQSQTPPQSLTRLRPWRRSLRSCGCAPSWRRRPLHRRRRRRPAAAAPGSVAAPLGSTGSGAAPGSVAVPLGSTGSGAVGSGGGGGGSRWTKVRAAEASSSTTSSQTSCYRSGQAPIEIPKVMKNYFPMPINRRISWGGSFGEGSIVVGTPSFGQSSVFVRRR